MISNIKTRVLIMAGGTGGHIFPGLAVAEHMKSKEISVFWLGSREGYEVEFLKGKEIKTRFIDISGLRGKGYLQILKAPFLLTRAVYQALKIIREFKPNVVLGMGGYVSGPGAVAAFLSRVPVVIHEQNAVMGTTNKIISKFAKKILVAFSTTHPDEIICGNPVNEKIITLDKKLERNEGKKYKSKLLILGGSRGALSINRNIPKALAIMTDDIELEVIHQTGFSHLESTLNVYKSELTTNAFSSIKVVPFIDDISEAYKWADFVVCRSGALTISELAHVGICSILIPFPHATDDHQFENAKILERIGAAEIVLHNQFTPEFMAEKISFYASNIEARNSMSVKGKLIAEINSTERVSDECLGVAHG